MLICILDRLYWRRISVWWTSSWRDNTRIIPVSLRESIKGNADTLRHCILTLESTMEAQASTRATEAASSRAVPQRPSSAPQRVKWIDHRSCAHRDILYIPQSLMWRERRRRSRGREASRPGEDWIGLEKTGPARNSIRRSNHRPARRLGEVQNPHSQAFCSRRTSASLSVDDLAAETCRINSIQNRE